MTKAKTPAEKLAIVEAKAAMWQAEAKKAQAEVFAVKQDFDIAKGQWNAEKLQLTSAAGAAHEAAKLEREDGNQLRARILDLELTVARQNGYLDGIEDSKPPVMVPEQRVRTRFGAGRDQGDFDPLSVIGSPVRRNHKRWFER